ncbi:hypothetical protein P4J24_22980 [Bacillus anthracis]|uniref:hypothetical protein n=1 Tax=Bacillus cereus group TaxID=86661 RepID=UPI00207BC3C0|nr:MULTISPECIES: hypothetical protein [Bacillus cereus group]MEB9684730.1 hypothetical protein [Bacillus anthracis]
MLKRIVFMSITGIIFMSSLTGCSYVGKLFTETYYVKIEGQGTKERYAFQYTLKDLKKMEKRKQSNLLQMMISQLKKEHI